MNLGTLMRSAHAFGANFFFTVDADQKIRSAPPSDTSKSPGHLPVFTWDERLTSVAAERAILETRGGQGGAKGRGKGRGKARAPGRGKKSAKGAKGEVDRVAACLILQAYLDSGGAGAGEVEATPAAPSAPEPS